MRLHVCVGLGVTECVSTSVYVHVCRALCPAPRRSETETCRHLGECVSLRFLNGCHARPNATGVRGESSATRENLFHPSPTDITKRKSNLYPLLYTDPNTMASTVRVVALKVMQSNYLRRLLTCKSSNQCNHQHVARLHARASCSAENSVCI